MAKKKYETPVLTVIEAEKIPPNIFDILDANAELNAIIDKVIRLRKYLIEHEGIVLESVNYAQGFLEVSKERLEEGVFLRDNFTPIAGEPGKAFHVRIGEEPQMKEFAEVTLEEFGDEAKFEVFFSDGRPQK